MLSANQFLNRLRQLPPAERDRAWRLACAQLLGQYSAYLTRGQETPANSVFETFAKLWDRRCRGCGAFWDLDELHDADCSNLPQNMSNDRRELLALLGR